LFFQRVHHLITMHRPLAQQFEQGEFHIAASKETASTTWPKMTTGAMGAAGIMGKWGSAKAHREGTRTAPLFLQPGGNPIIATAKLEGKMLFIHHS
jgi:hypothetical protein